LVGLKKRVVGAKKNNLSAEEELWKGACTLTPKIELWTVRPWQERAARARGSWLQRLYLGRGDGKKKKPNPATTPQKKNPHTKKTKDVWRRKHEPEYVWGRGGNPPGGKKRKFGRKTRVSNETN